MNTQFIFIYLVGCVLVVLLCMLDRVTSECDRPMWIDGLLAAGSWFTIIAVGFLAIWRNF